MKLMFITILSVYFVHSSTCLPSDIEPVKAADVFKGQRDVLTDQLQHDLPNIASKLYTESIISAATLAEAMNQVNIASVRTVSLLSVVEDKIRAEPHVFIKFVEILETEPVLRSQAKDLVKKYHCGTCVIATYTCMFQFRCPVAYTGVGRWLGLRAGGGGGGGDNNYWSEVVVDL